jgi:hypothetical protein
MASWIGVLYDPPSKATTQMSQGPLNVALATPTLVPQYKMTGWYPTGAVYETWTSYRYPNTTPPSGHALTGISYVQVQ